MSAETMIGSREILEEYRRKAGKACDKFYEKEGMEPLTGLDREEWIDAYVLGTMAWEIACLRQGFK